MKNNMIAAIVIAVAATSGITAQETRRQGNASRTPQRSKYLETGGERKLEVVYKNISGRDLTLDLYYPTARRSDKVSGDCLYAWWGMGRRQQIQSRDR